MSLILMLAFFLLLSAFAVRRYVRSMMRLKMDDILQVEKALDRIDEIKKEKTGVGDIFYEYMAVFRDRIPYGPPYGEKWNFPGKLYSLSRLLAENEEFAIYAESEMKEQFDVFIEYLDSIIWFVFEDLVENPNEEYAVYKAKLDMIAQASDSFFVECERRAKRCMEQRLSRSSETAVKKRAAEGLEDTQMSDLMGKMKDAVR